MINDPNILIPCKPFADGKSRLSTVLDAAGREKLCRDLLLNTLAVAGQAFSFSQISVITSDPEVRATAARCGVTTIPDVGGGQNPAIAFARDAVVARANPDDALMILPIDLPQLSVASLAEITNLDGEVVLVPDDLLIGTNIVLLRGRAKRIFSFSFGERSLQHHRRIADRLGLCTTVAHHPFLSFDLDRSADYKRWQRSGGRLDACARSSRVRTTAD
jgi:2-phospho-L-lactate/phosphoenolpyruvate guanylyltransferase